MARTPGKNKTRYVKHCEFCGIEFESTRIDAKFCCGSHRAMYGQDKRRDLDSAKLAETQNKIEGLIREIQKSNQAEAKEFGNWLKKWLNEFSDKLKTAILNHDIKALEEIHTKLSKVVKELELIENE